MDVAGPWAVVFDNPMIDVHRERTFDTLSDWTVHPEETIRTYSGTAAYTTTFTLDAKPVDRDLFLDLGRVGIMAEVRVNGQFAGGSWMPPHVLNITDLVQAGQNRLEIEVVNLWRNHLVKDKTLPEGQQKTWLTVSDVKADEALQPSGLIGPVRLATVDRK
jgi:hypothetical protein